MFAKRSANNLPANALNLFLDKSVLCAAHTNFEPKRALSWRNNRIGRWPLFAKRSGQTRQALLAWWADFHRGLHLFAEQRLARSLWPLTQTKPGCPFSQNRFRLFYDLD